MVNFHFFRKVCAFHLQEIDCKNYDASKLVALKNVSFHHLLHSDDNISISKNHAVAKSLQITKLTSLYYCRPCLFKCFCEVLLSFWPEHCAFNNHFNGDKTKEFLKTRRPLRRIVSNLADFFFLRFFCITSCSNCNRPRFGQMLAVLKICCKPWISFFKQDCGHKFFHSKNLKFR